MTNKQLEQLLYDCYEALFQAATPSVSFYALLAEATINEREEHVIPFEDYELEEEAFDAILSEYADKVRPKWRRNAFKAEVLLGCSPNYTK